MRSSGSSQKPGSPYRRRRGGALAGALQWLVSVSGYLIGSQEAGRLPLPPEAELQWWYQYYFATERGQAGYERYRRDFAELIWRTASPQWDFDDATFDRSAASFDNPDHVAIVIHNYRWRLGLADGEAEYADLEQQLAAGPAAAVPTITLEGDAQRRTASATRSLRREILRPVHAPDDRERDRAQPSPGGTAGIRGRSPRGRSRSLSLFSSVRGTGSLPVEGHLPRFGGATGWLNWPPLTDEDVEGKVVFVDFWTFTCINWLRTLAYVPAWAERYTDQGLVVVGVHTPEFPVRAGHRQRSSRRGGHARRQPGRPRQRLRDLAGVREPLLARRVHRRRGRQNPAPPVRRGRLRRVRDGHPAVAARAWP